MRRASWTYPWIAVLLFWIHIDVGLKPNRCNLQSPLLWHSGWTTRKLCWLGRPNFDYDLRNRVKLLIYGYDRIVSKTASDCFHTHLRRCWCTRLLHCSQWEGYFHSGIQLSWVPQWVDMDLWNSKRSLFMTGHPVATVIAGQSSWKQCAVQSRFAWRAQDNEMHEICRKAEFKKSVLQYQSLYTHCKNNQFSTISALTGAKKQDSISINLPFP